MHYYVDLPSSSAARRTSRSFAKTDPIDSALEQCKKHSRQLADLRRRLRLATSGLEKLPLLQEITLGEEKFSRAERLLRRYPDMLDELRRYMETA